ncbi:hypothetical protein NA57DRAFT_51545 [Rhizodiscina lignyota]|uniref:F-box domain-containing protein n=1 Tax=Rhizodiscina lignyota TaxID=1504668 RepID=A0A9P4MGR2_9PEZI|nr:hypothetical protein NA57DRAFT_51545 [Rhizodiscina lignyota]
MATTLESLPEEITENIFSHLSIPHQRAFRLTSRQLRDKSFHRFAKNFAHVELIISKPSLQRLDQISNHPRFANAVRALSINVAWYIMDDDSGDQATSTRKANYWRQWHILDNFVQRESSLIRSGLDSALRRLKNCHSIRFTQLHHERGLGHPLGRHTFCFSVPQPDELNAFTYVGSMIIQQLVDVVTESSIQLNDLAIEVHLKSWRHIRTNCLSYLPIPYIELPMIRFGSGSCGLGALKTLSLNMKISDSPNPQKLSLFLAHTPSLKEINLKIPSWDGCPRIGEILEACSQLQDAQLPPLETIRIKTIAWIKSAQLEAFLCLFARTLRNLQLAQIEIFGSWDLVIGNLRNKLNLKFITVRQCYETDREHDLWHMTESDVESTTDLLLKYEMSNNEDEDEDEDEGEGEGSLSEVASEAEVDDEEDDTYWLSKYAFEFYYDGDDANDD